MPSWSDNARASNKAAKAARNADADEQIAAYRSGKSRGRFLSFGGSAGHDAGHTRSPGLFGLGSRVVEDMTRENAKSGFYGFFGAKHVAEKAKQAESGRTRGRGWLG
jgi:hypothetical protein